MSSNSKSGLLSNVSNNPSTLRPRSTRLISYLDEEGDNNLTSRGGRAISSSTTTPSTGLRATSATRRSGKTLGPTDSDEAGSVQSKRGSGANGLWDSWTQIQGIASTFLGSDTSAIGTNTNTRTGGSFKTPAWMKQDRNHVSNRQAQKWGPRAPDHVGVGPGMIEERQAMLQAKKREALLLAATTEGKDASGRFKRKGSDASLSVHSPSRTDDVLVYKHKVLPDDTMAGLAIKYSCQQEVFRKVNRLWPNDRIQIRDYVYLPVDACAIRGRRLDGPVSDDLLGDFSKPQKLADTHELHSNGIVADTDLSNVQDSSTTASPMTEEETEDYKHDSWVSLPNFSQAVEILRMRRTTLGYFPPARRKPNHHLLTTGIESAVSSPRTSFDNLRHPPSHAAQQAQLQQQTARSVSAESSTNQPSQKAQSIHSSSRHRSHSTATTSSQQTNVAANSFFSALRGPGGVGSLRGLRTESSRPGPADDRLNQNFAKYLPSLALTLESSGDSHNHNTDYPLPHARAYAASQTLGLPRASMDSLRSSRSGRSNSSTSAFGAGVENWVKKIASATTGTTRSSTTRTSSDRTIGPTTTTTGVGPSMGIGIGGETGLGDLIELETNPDARDFLSTSATTTHHPINQITHDDDNDDDGSETPRLGTTMSKAKMFKTSREDLLNERFPIRGKVTKAYGAKN